MKHASLGVVALVKDSAVRTDKAWEGLALGRVATAALKGRDRDRVYSLAHNPRVDHFNLNPAQQGCPGLLVNTHATAQQQKARKHRLEPEQATTMKMETEMIFKV